ncbi:hypothetical protein MUK42_18632, partial [Musa troglodytarum]
MKLVVSINFLYVSTRDGRRERGSSSSETKARQRL